MNLIIGHGQIGKAVHEVIGESLVVDKVAPDLSGIVIDVMHVCIPYSDEFIEVVKSYKKQFKPKHLIIYSTVPIGTTKQIKDAVHSPVEGVHPRLTESITIMPRWIGCNKKSEGTFFEEYFENLGIQARIVQHSNCTEALKLLSTSEYGINIVFADYKKKIADEIRMNYSIMKDWNNDYNDLYEDLGLHQYRKYVLDPPKGRIGGHCVVPNAEILDKQFPNAMLKMIKEMK
jgi:UDP-N-acetyl-D-mannosaminuronate dehydrogenase